MRQKAASITHPLHTLTSRSPIKRRKKEALFLLGKNIINSSATELLAYDIEYNNKDNHTTAVEKYSESIPSNKLIDDYVSEINHSEETLERIQRTRLAQLRTNKSPLR